MLSDLSVGERSGRVIVRSGKGNEARTVPLNASARLALAVYLAPQWEFVEKKYRDPIYTQRSAHFAVIWYVVSFRQKYTDRPSCSGSCRTWYSGGLPPIMCRPSALRALALA